MRNAGDSIVKYSHATINMTPHLNVNKISAVKNVSIVMKSNTDVISLVHEYRHQSFPVYTSAKLVLF